MLQSYDFDTVILGGGPAGLSAGIYASRGAVSTALIDVSMMGGQPSNYLELENYPGFPVVGGYDKSFLCRKLKRLIYWLSLKL